MSNWLPDITTRQGTKYRALAECLREAVLTGELTENQKLLPHREMAMRLGLAVATVARAYGLCKQWGFLVGRVGDGTRVTHPSSQRGVITLEEGHREIDLGLLVPTPVSNPGLRQAAYRDAFARVGDRLALQALAGYAPDLGYQAHRRSGVQLLSKLGVAASASQVIVTHGAQEAFLLLLETMSSPGDAVLVDEYCYLGFKQLCHAIRRRPIPVKGDATGMLPEHLTDSQAKSSATILFANPTLHNPTGATWSERRRKEVLEICHAADVTVIEDDVFGLLADTPPPALAELAPERVCHVTSLSKISYAAIRVAYLKTPVSWVPRLEKAKHALTVSGCALQPAIVADWMETGALDGLVADQKREIKARWKIARRLLGSERIDGMDPAPFLWLSAGEHWRASELVASIRDRGVRCVDGDQFTVGRAASPGRVRVALSTPRSRNELERGLMVLAELLDAPVGTSNTLS
jgi:DNA-binding transcriptional MocR family regulator